MRAGRVVAAVVAASVVLPTLAHAGPRADFKMLFTRSAPGVSTGVDVRLLYKRPGDPQGKPRPVREEQFTFPAGTKFDSAAVPPCRASDLQLQLQGNAACPRASWVGRGIGDTIMTGFPGPAETPIRVDGFLDGPDVKLVTQANGFPLRFIAHATSRGRVTTVKIPRAPGGPPDGESALRRVHNVFPARSSGGHIWQRTPPVCPPSGVWTFRGRFTFADGAVEHDVYRMRCKRLRR